MHLSPRIPADDIERLTRLAHDPVDRLDPHGPLLLRKLERTSGCGRDHAVRASLDSFVAYRVLGEGREERRLLIHPDGRMWPPLELSVSSPLGIALLGAAPGDRVHVAGSGLDDPPAVDVLKVEQVGASGFVRHRSSHRVVGGSYLMA